MEVKDTIFPAPLDLDSSEQEIKGLRYLLNCRQLSEVEGQAGVITNIRGTDLVQTTLPGGTNKCIGGYDDETNKTVIYLLWNSAGNHSIYRYFVATNTINKIRQSKFLNFSETGLISSMSLVGDLFYWTQEDNPQRKINIAKADNTGKNAETNIYLLQSINPGRYDFQILINGQAYHSINQINSITTRENAIKGIVQELKNDWKTFADITNEGNYIKVVAKGFGSVSIRPPDGKSIWAVGQNYYEGDYEQYIDAIKYPAWLPPAATLFKDSKKTFNYIRGNTFQFRVKYIFDDNESGTLSAYSTLALDKNVTGNDPLKTSKNGITIDYTDNGRLFTQSYRNQVKRVELFFRTSSIDRDKFITAIEQWDLSGTYSFYNEGIYTEIDPAVSTLNYSALPVRSWAMEYFESSKGGGGRLFYASNLTGYQKIPIDAKIGVGFNDSPQQKGCTIIGNMTILNAIGGIGAATHNTGVIASDGTDYWYGCDFTGSDFKNRATKAGQLLSSEVRGFVFYLAGTSHYGIASYNTGQGQSSPNEYGLNYAVNLYQFKITNVPPGRYKLRLAAPFCHYGGGDVYDLNREDLAWQTSSCPLLWFAGYGSGYGSDRDHVTSNPLQELEIEVREGTEVIDLTQTANYLCFHNGLSNSLPGSNGKRGLFIVADLTYHSDTERAAGFMGYAVQSESGPADHDGVLDGKRLGWAEFRGLSASPNTQTHAASSERTDHNGFFWIVNSYIPTSNFIGFDIGIANVQIFNNTVYDNNTKLWIGNLNGISLGPTTPRVIDAIFQIMVPVSFPNVANALRAKVTGTAINSATNEPVPNIPVVIDRAGFGFTDDNGVFSVMVYKNDIDASYDQSSSQDILAVQGTKIFVNNQVFPLSLSEQFKGYRTGAVNNLYYNSENDQYPHSTGNLTVSYVSLIASAIKRGEHIQYGIIYGDRGNRTSSVLTDDRFRFYIPAPGEDLGNYFPQYSSGTYIFGQPSLSWTINHLPPDWATWYAWVRTPRKIQWLQIPIGGAEYVKFFDSSGSVTDIPANNKGAYGDSSVTQVFLDIKTLQYYKDQHSQSLLGYEWTQGDRLRLIMDDGGDFFSWDSAKTYDVEILGQYGFKIIIPYLNNMPELKEGAVIEIYRVADTGQDIKYLEIGEFYEVVNGYHKGQQNQTASLPATGTFKNGDAWIRQRTMLVENFTGTNTPRNIIFYCEDPAVSDFYGTRETNDTGRINIYEPEQHQLDRIANVCFTDRIIEGSFINGLNLVQPLNNEDTNIAYGRLRRLKVSGGVMLGIHERETVSIYIGQTLTIDAQTNTNVVALSDKVIGTIYPLLGGFGTRHPESVDSLDGNTFWWDDNKATIVMYSGNGLHPVGDEYFASSYLKTKKNQSRVLGYCDLKRGEYTVHFGNEGLIFNKKASRFTHFINYQLAEMLCKSSIQCVGFKDGQLYTLETSSDYGNFFGTKYEYQIRAIAKENPVTDKTWMALSYKSNELWEAPEIKNDKGQLSNLIAEDFELMNGVYSAPFLRDQNTPVDNAINEGDFMQSEIINILLRNNSSNNVLFYWLHVTANINHYTI